MARRGRDVTRRRHDLAHSTYAGPVAKGKAAPRLRERTPQRHGITVDAGHLARLLAHDFDLLGSRYREVRHGVSCAGFTGYRYPSGPQVHPDQDGAWLHGRVTPANETEVRRIWAQVDPGYTPLDWQLDFKSGWRWSEHSWYRDVRFGDRPGADIKVPWELARMQHLPRLALAYVAARGRGWPHKADALRREFRNQVLDFIATNPPRFGVNWVTSMEVAIRLVNWLVALDLFRAAGATFDEPFLQVLGRSVQEHGHHIVTNLEWSRRLRSNHYLANVVGLLFAGAYLPRGGEADGWLALGAAELIAEGTAQLLPDGGGFEASTSYHRLTAEMVAWGTALLAGLTAEERRVVEVAASRRSLPRHVVRRSRWLGPATGWRTVEDGVALLARRLELAAEFSIDITKPDGRVVQVGDNDSGRLLVLVPEEPLVHRSLVRTIGGLIRREDFATFGGDGPEGALIAALSAGRVVAPARSPGTTAASAVRVGEAWPAPPATGGGVVRIVIPIPGGGVREGLRTAAYPDFGLYVYRSDRLFLAIRCGPVGQNGFGGHAHNDQLSIELSMDGEPWIRDPGTYVYTALPERRNAYRSASAHFGPRLAEGEPARLDLDLFRLGPGTSAECTAWGPDGFAGIARYAGRRAVRGWVRPTDETVEVTYAYEGCRPAAAVLAASADWRAMLPTVPFSPGYGLLEQDGNS
jgi:hypothetical protein